MDDCVSYSFLITYKDNAFIWDVHECGAAGAAPHRLVMRLFSGSMGYIVQFLLFGQLGVVDELVSGGQSVVEPRDVELTARFEELVIVAEVEERVAFIKVVALGVASDLVGGE